MFINKYLSTRFGKLLSSSGQKEKINEKILHINLTIQKHFLIFYYFLKDNVFMGFFG